MSFLSVSDQKPMRHPRHPHALKRPPYPMRPGGMNWPSQRRRPMALSGLGETWEQNGIMAYGIMRTLLQYDLSSSDRADLSSAYSSENWETFRLVAKRIAKKLGIGFTGLQGLGDMGAQPNYGTRAWWQWYATQYLPQFYSRAQAYQVLQSSPFYGQFGLPQIYQQYAAQYQQPYYPSSYGYNQYQQPYNYSSPYGQYAPQYSQQRYIPYGGTDQGAVACNQQGGTYDAFNMSCSAPGSSAGNTVVGYGAPPNVVGQSEWSAVQTLNNNGWLVWLINQDSIPQGVPQDYNTRRVLISVANGVVTSQSVG